MFSLLKSLITLFILGGLVYFIFFVSLGEHTLWKHLVRISQTNEAKELSNQLEKKAENLKKEVVQKIPTSTREEKAPSDNGITSPASLGNSKSNTSLKKGEAQKNSLSNLSKDDRKALMQLLKEKQKQKL